MNSGLTGFYKRNSGSYQPEPEFRGGRTNEPTKGGRVESGKRAHCSARPKLKQRSKSKLGRKMNTKVGLDTTHHPPTLNF